MYEPAILWAADGLPGWEGGVALLLNYQNQNPGEKENLTLSVSNSQIIHLGNKISKLDLNMSILWYGNYITVVTVIKQIIFSRLPYLNIVFITYHTRLFCEIICVSTFDIWTLVLQNYCNIIARLTFSQVS